MAPDREWADAPGSAPAVAILPGRPVPQFKSRPDPAVAPAGITEARAARTTEIPGRSARDWPDVRRRLQALGVTRYWTEGEPNGAARFRCVIPLAGQRAVSQQFEGEGDDDLQAAEAALRRVALWKATESR
jgi:hypothetical protein